MKDEKNNKKQIAKIFTGKMFYAALFVCLAVTCAAGWAAISSSRSKTSGLTLQAGSLTSQSENTFSDSDLFVFSEEPENYAVSEPVIEEETQVAQILPPAEQASEPSAPAEAEIPADEEPKSADKPVIETLELDERLPALFVWPLGGSVDTPFSVNALIYDITMKDWRTHDGIDISAAAGAKVSAVADGTVTKVYNDDMYGTTVIISHSGGMESTYSNLAAVPLVSEGDSVCVGDDIGAVGSTALAESGMGTHLHLAFRLNGVPVDPRDYLTAR